MLSSKLSKVGVLLERHDNSQVECSFYVGETLVFRMCSLLENRLAQKKCVSPAWEALFFMIQICQVACPTQLGRACLSCGRRSVKKGVFYVDESVLFVEACHFTRTRHQL